MTLLPTEEHPVETTNSRSFLRTAPDTAVRARTAGAPAPAGHNDAPPSPVFPAPDMDEAIAARLAEWPRFAAMAVRVDPPANAAADGPLHAALTAFLEKMVGEPNGGLWFEWDTGLFGCAVSGIDGCAAEALAQQLQSELARSRVETVSVGISEFPLLEFDRSAAMHNACKALDHAAFFGPGHIVICDAVSLNISGDQLYQSGDFDGAIAEYEAALRLDADSVNVHNSLGVVLAQNGRTDDARRSFEEAARIDPEEAMAVFNLGVLALLNNDKAQALERFRQAFALDAQTFDIPFQTGKLLTEEKAYAEALTYLQTAAELGDANAAVHHLIGRCLACLERSEEAIGAYTKAIRLNPNDAAALSALGTLYDAKGENPEISLTFCRQSVAVAPDNGLFRLRLGRLYQKHNQLTAALAEYETAAALGCDAQRQIAEVQELLAGEDDRQCCA